jgi:hypothetical protein
MTNDEWRIRADGRGQAEGVKPLAIRLAGMLARLDRRALFFRRFDVEFDGRLGRRGNDSIAGFAEAAPEPGVGIQDDDQEQQ